MLERQNLYDLSYRNRKKCWICGESIEMEQPFYCDGHSTVHLDCHFNFLKNEEDRKNACTV